MLLLFKDDMFFLCFTECIVNFCHFVVTMVFAVVVVGVGACFLGVVVVPEVAFLSLLLNVKISCKKLAFFSNKLQAN